MNYSNFNFTNFSYYYYCFMEKYYNYFNFFVIIDYLMDIYLQKKILFYLILVVSNYLYFYHQI